MIDSMAKCRLISVAVICCLALICCRNVLAVASWHGTVVDARTGEPVAGVKLSAGCKGASWESSESGSDGKFTVKYSEYTTKTMAKSGDDYYLRTSVNPKEMPYLSQQYRARPIPKHLEVRLMPFMAHFKGRVIDAETGEPISRVKITLQPAERGITSANVAESDDAGELTWSPNIAFNQLAPYYKGSNSVPEALRVPTQPILEPLHYSVAAYAEGYKQIKPVEVPGRSWREKEWTWSLPLQSSYTDIVYTWLEIRMVKGNFRESVDPAKYVTAELRGTQKSAGKGVPSAKAPSSPPISGSGERIIDIWNKAVCNHTDSITFTLNKSTPVSRILIWHDWKPAEKKLAYKLLRNGKVVKSGKFTRGNADPYQKNWVEGVIVVNDTLAPGTYRIKVPSGRAAINSGAPQGFVRIFGKGSGEASKQGKSAGSSTASPPAKKETRKKSPTGTGISTGPKTPGTAAHGEKPDSSPPSSNEPAQPPVEISASCSKPAIAVDYSMEDQILEKLNSEYDFVNEAGEVVDHPGFNRMAELGIVQIYHVRKNYWTQKNGQWRKDKKPFTGLLRSGRSDVPLQDGKKHGVETCWYVDDPNNGVNPVRESVHWNCTWRDGFEHGIYKKNHENGNIASCCTYVNGFRQGPAYEFYPEGGLMYEYTYKDGKMHGLWQSYSPDGTPSSQRIYHHGKAQR